MVAQQRHDADPAATPAEEVRARARLFRSVVEAEGRRSGGEEEGALLTALVQRIDYSNQLLLALLNTQRASVGPSSVRLACVR